MSKKDELTPKQEIFCRWFAETGNATEAYRQAYDCQSSTPESVNVMASRLAKKVKIRLRVNELLEERSKALKDERALYKEAMRDILGSDVSDLFYEDRETGQMKVRSPLQLPLHTRRAIKKVTVNKGRISYEFADKIAAGKALADLEGWDKPNEQNVNIKYDGIIPINDL